MVEPNVSRANIDRTNLGSVPRVLLRSAARFVKYWETIADNLSKAGFSLG